MHVVDVVYAVHVLLIDIPVRCNTCGKVIGK